MGSERDGATVARQFEERENEVDARLEIPKVTDNIACAGSREVFGDRATTMASYQVLFQSLVPVQC